MNPNLLEALALPLSDVAPPSSESSGYGGIIGKNLINLVPKAVNSLGGSLEGILNFQMPESSKIDVPELPNFGPEPTLGPESTTGQRVTNVLTGGVLPELAALLIPYAAATKVGKLAGLGKLGQTILGNVAQGAVGGIKYSPEAAVEGAALGGVLSGIGAVPGVLRRAALTAPIAGLEYGLHQDEGAGQAATAAATTLLGGLLPSISRPKVGDIEVLPPEAGPLGLPYDPRRQMRSMPSGPIINMHPATNTADYPLGLPGPATAPDARYWNMLEWPHGDALNYSPSGEVIHAPGPPPLYLPEKRGAYETPLIGGEDLASSLTPVTPPRELSYIEAEMPGLAISRGIPQSNIKPRPVIDVSQLDTPTFTPSGQPSMGAVPKREMFAEPQNVDQNMIEASKEAAQRGKLQDLPEYRRTTGGIIAPELLNTLGQSALGGLIGGTIDANTDVDGISFGVLGAGLPLIAPIARGLARTIGGSEEGSIRGIGLTDAEGRLLAEGKIGQTHADIKGQALDRLLTEQPDADPFSIKHVFTGPNGETFSREEAWTRAAQAGIIKPDVLASKTASGKMYLESQDLAGIATPEILSSLGGGIAGGLVGYAASEGDPYAAGAGAILGAAGSGAVAAAFKSPGIARTAQAVKSELGQAKTQQQLTSSLKSAATDLIRGNTYGQGGPFSKLFDFVDKQFRVTMPAILKAGITEARGRVAMLAERSMAYLKSYLSSGVPASLVDRANTYLDGISNSVTDETNFLRANGAIDSIAYEQLQPSQRKGYTTWRVSEDTPNPTGVGPHQAFKMHVPLQQLDQLKEQWNNKLTQDFLAGVSADELPAAQAVVKARTNFNEIQKFFAAALPAGPLQQSVTESIGRYVPRIFRAFTDKNFKVDDAKVKAYLNEFGLNRRGALLEDAVKSGEAYDSTTFTSLLNRPNQSLRTQQRLAQYVPYNVDGRNLHVLPGIKDQFDALKNDVHLENMVRAHIQEEGVAQGMQRTGAATGGLDPTMFKERENLTPAYRELLGEITDPAERMAMAFSRTFAPAQAASLMDIAKNISLPSGLKSAYEPAEWSQLLSQAQGTGNLKMVEELKQMKLIGKSANFGEYAGNYVNRHLADYFEGGSQIWNQSLGRSIADFNRYFKTGHVPLNPISHIRQIVSIPAFLAIGKAAPEDVRQAWNALFAGAKEEGTPNALLRDKMLSRGVWTSDLIKGELQGNIDTFLSGRYDSELMKATKGGVNKVLEAYRKPDMLVRAATYIGAERRALSQGKTAEEAAQIALEWMDRYTMNYDNIAPAIRYLRNIPGVSPFISYQAEMFRLVKNMVDDGIHGNPERLGTLATITALPLGAAMVAENNLNPEDRKEWAKTKALMPDYNKGKIYIPTGKNPNGSFKFWDISPDIAHSDLIKLVNNVATGNFSAAIEQNPFAGLTSSPILQAVAKVVAHVDPRTGQELGSTGSAALSAVSDFLPPITPGLGYEWKRLANVEVENLYTGKKESWGDWATRFASGATGSSVRLSTLQDSLKKEFNRTAANARADYLRTARLTGSNPGLDARKAEAYENYRQTMADAVTEFQQRFGASS